MVDKAEIKSINDSTYEVEMPSGDKVEIGDKEAVDFKPSLKLNRWDGECFIKLGLPTADKITPVVEVGKVKWRGQKMETHFYPLEPKVVATKDKDGRDRQFGQNELGGFEFEIVLKEKPATNQIALDIQMQGLRFAYQPPLTQQEIEQGAIRPENVVGSYAVYHATKKNNEYMTGKAFHIYRPHLADAVGAEAWADLNINGDVLTITLPQDFLDEAIYPVTVDPDFGYDTIGGSSVEIADKIGVESFRVGSAWEMLAPGGTANLIKAYMDGANACDCTAFINQKDSVAAGQHGQIAVSAEVTCYPPPNWWEFPLASEALTSGVVYILNVMGDHASLAGGTYYIYFDENGAEAVASYYELHNYAAPESPWVVAAEGTTRDYSIYCNYTEVAPPVGLENKSANMGSKMVAAGLI